MLERSIRSAVVWTESVPDVRISMNVSAHESRENGFVGEVERVLAREGLPQGARLREVTESALITDRGEAIEALKDLAASGIPIALDAFGTGYSSLSCLQRFPVHILKIDRDFVSRGVDERSGRLAQTTVELGRA